MSCSGRQSKEDVVTEDMGIKKKEMESDMNELMKEIIKRYSLLGISVIASFTIWDLVKGEGFHWDKFISGIIIETILLLILGWAEYRRQKKK